MIATSINHITKYLNQACKNAFDLNEDIAVISNLIEQDGSVPPNIDNKLVVSLVNIEKDGVAFKPSFKSATHTRSDAKKYPPVHLNLYVMVSSYFTGKNYIESLKFLSFAMTFFQRNSVFDHTSTPDLDPAIDKLILDIENLDMKDFSSLWSVISGKYVPSILYKMRMVTIDSDAVSNRVPTLEEISIIVRSNG